MASLLTIEMMLGRLFDSESMTKALDAKPDLFGAASTIETLLSTMRMRRGERLAERTKRPAIMPSGRDVSLAKQPSRDQSVQCWTR
jgi:hypothetical protein